MSKVTHVLNASSRQILGTKVKSLRKSGLIPANIYGKGIASQAVQVAEKDLNKVFETAGESSLVSVTIDEKDTFPVIFKNPFYNPISGLLAHLDMYKVNLKEKISAMVPIVLVGEAPAVKQGLEMIEIISEVEVEALPADLPEKVEVDISKLETAENMVTVGDIKLDSKITVLTAPETVIVKVEEHKEEVIETAPAEPVEVPATAQKSPEEIAAEDAAKKEEKEKEDK